MGGIIWIMKEGFTELPDDHWFRVTEKLKAKFEGEKPSPMQIRAEVLLELAGIPSGPYSSIKTDERGERTDPKGDKIIAENITNKAGLLIEGTNNITSRDLRDRYPDGLPEEVLTHLNEKTRKIIEAMYAYEEYARKNSSENFMEVSTPVNLHFLPGGIPYVSVGVRHTKEWMSFYGRFMKDMGKEAEVICVEGYFDKPSGDSLKRLWKREDDNGYELNMRNLVRNGYDGYFTEVDGRDESRVSIDSKLSLMGNFRFPNLPGSFYEKYLEYLKREDPEFGNNIGNSERLKNFLKKQSVEGFSRGEDINNNIKDKKLYGQRMSLTDKEEQSTKFTGNELGALIYSDAVASIKLHLLGKMMNDGIIPKGAIVDYEGALHNSSKSFFMENPEYAMETVLRTLPNLLAGTADKSLLNYFAVEDFSEKIFDRTNWEQVIREIFRISLKKVALAKGEKNSVDPGRNQRPMTEIYPDEYVLETILTSQKEGERELKDWVNEMDTLIQKFK